jgi:DNA-binding transcriptional MerR regulator
MTTEMTIGTVSHLTGLTVKAIRFYEEGGYIPRAGRSEAGYRLYSAGDVRRLRLLRRARRLGVSLRDIRTLVDKAASASCDGFTAHLLQILANRRDAVQRQISELNAVLADLDTLEGQVEGCRCDGGSCQSAADCNYCAILNEEGGETNGREA